MKEITILLIGLTMLYMAFQVNDLKKEVKRLSYKIEMQEQTIKRLR
jgi:cell division protein FtsL